MMTRKQNPGLYIHVPFCRSKCPYCDFYSFTAGNAFIDEYTDALIKNIILWQNDRSLTFSTVYFGGGTPSLLGSKRLCKVLDAIECETDAEITVECNPSDLAENWHEADMQALAHHGVNRISMGLQSAVDSERKKLGRRAGRAEVEKALKMVKAAGITNFSLDLMLGIPFQTVESVKESVDFCVEKGACHVSAYLLKIEQGTPFEKVEKTLCLPEEDECCEMYLTACERLENAGIKQYEISNFARPGLESRHNLVYWDDREYLGIGAAAHSFLGGKRFFYTPDAQAFVSGAATEYESEGGSFEEYAMLRLRLSAGLTESGAQARFGKPIPQAVRSAAEKFATLGLLINDENSIRLTPRGFLVSNTIISELI